MTSAINCGLPTTHPSPLSSGPVNGRSVGPPADPALPTDTRGQGDRAIAKPTQSNPEMLRYFFPGITIS